MKYGDSSFFIDRIYWNQIGCFLFWWYLTSSCVNHIWISFSFTIDSANIFLFCKGFVNTNLLSEAWKLAASYHYLNKLVFKSRALFNLLSAWRWCELNRNIANLDLVKIAIMVSLLGLSFLLFWGHLLWK